MPNNCLYQLLFKSLKQHFKAMKQNIVKLAKYNVLNKSTLFVFLNSYPVNANIGSPCHNSYILPLHHSMVCLSRCNYTKVFCLDNSSSSQKLKNNFI